MRTTLKIDHAALHQLHQGLAIGVGELAEATVAEAMPHKPKAASVGVVTLLEGAPIAGTTTPPTGAAGGQIEAFAVFGSPSGWVEFGTPAHDIVAKRKALKLPGGRFARRVHSRGSKAKPFINPALALAVGAAETLIRRGVAKRYH